MTDNLSSKNTFLTLVLYRCFPMTHLFKARYIVFASITCFCLIYIHAAAQQPPEKKLAFEALTIDDGLSQGMVNSIIQDRFGFMWFATKDGLNRYDGYHFVVYRHEVNNKSSLADNFINVVFEDSRGRLWVGTATSGLDLFDRAAETFTHFRHNESDSNSINGNNITAIKQRSDGLIFVTTNQGLCVLIESEDKNGQPFFLFKTIMGGYTCLSYPGYHNTLWITPGDNKLYCLTGNNKPGFVKKAFAFADLPAQQSTGYRPLIQSVASDTLNHILYFIRYNAVIKYDEKNGAYENITGNNFEVKFITQPVFYSNGNIWIPNDARLLVFDVKKRTTLCIQSANPRFDIMVNSINCVYEDRSGNLWIGTSGYGLLKYNARADKFHHTDNVSIGWMQEDNNGNILIVKRGDLVWLFDKKTRSFVDKMSDNSNIKDLFKGGIEAAVQDKDGSYWIARQKLLHYNNTAKTYEYPVLKKGLCFPLYNDNDDILWMGTDDALAAYNKRTKHFTYYPYPVYTDNTPYKFIEAVYQQNDSIFWLGTLSGLFRFNKNTGTWKQFKNDPADTSSLSYDLIFSLCADPVYPNKFLWVGTNGGGLNRFDISTGKFLRYSTKDGLPNDVVYGILADDDGNLWISTNKGLSRFTLPEDRAGSGSFYNYEAKDGLQSNEFNRYAFCKAKDGTLFFGGVNGFNYFDPRNLSNNTVPPNIIITDFKIANDPVAIYGSNNLLQKPIYLTDKIVLKYKYNMLSFEFAAMDFSQPGKNLYQYKLEGFDENWIQSGTAHTATYTNLDPGTYTFRVKGSNSDGIWNEKGTSVQLVILPPWYMTWWLRTLLSITIIALVYIFYRYRLQQALRLQAVRNRIASDLHDEIGSNLSNISIFSNVAQQNASNENNALLKKISEYTQVSMEAMSDIVWMINARNDRFENIIIRMRSLAAEIFEAKHCTLHIELDDRLNNIKLNMEKRKNFYLIYKEAINNIAKYAACKDVWINMQMQHNEVLLQIKDNGNGFDVAKRKNGNGLFNMQHRAEMLNGKLIITSKIDEGTLVELRFEV